MYGTTDTTFAPDEALTRGMFVTMLYRLESKPEVTGNTSFTDSRCQCVLRRRCRLGKRQRRGLRHQRDGVLARRQDHSRADGGHDAPVCKLQEDRHQRESGPFRLRGTPRPSAARRAMTWKWRPFHLSSCTATTTTNCSPRPNATRAQAAAIQQRVPTKIVSKAGRAKEGSGAPRMIHASSHSIPF